MEALKKKLHHTWVNVLLKLKILLPLNEGSARLNVRNPLAYIVIGITMLIQYVLNVIWAVVASIFGGVADLIIIYTSTIRRGFELEEIEKVKAVRAEMQRVKESLKVVKP
jgi:hypothetical protein